MFCPNCGSRLEDGAKFCQNCGARLEEELGTSATSAVPETSQSFPVKQHRPSSMNESKDKTGFQAKWEAAASYVHDKKNRKKLIAGVVVAVLAVFYFANVGWNKDISTVKAGHFYSAQNITVGDAFEKFFAHAKWTSEVKNGTHFVYFEGDAGNTQGKGYKKFHATFVVSPAQGTFQMTRTMIDGHDVTESQSTFIPQICAGASQISYTYER